MKLTNRETDILEHLSNGLIYNEIAENLFISPSIVRKHLENRYKKLQGHNRIEAVYKAKKYRIAPFLNETLAFIRLYFINN
ncbi:response regulator transcription factor [Lutibacter profundi]|uniref:response regulator transcription factor n=1 Tax=Lutibacter profundi TaxID=1622118 RepID=UPI001D103DA4|nr:LuxR C-terminal-related transcriptional regulator [Lutibacter profundi]